MSSSDILTAAQPYSLYMQTQPSLVCAIMKACVCSSLIRVCFCSSYPAYVRHRGTSNTTDSTEQQTTKRSASQTCVFRLDITLKQYDRDLACCRKQLTSRLVLTKNICRRMKRSLAVKLLTACSYVKNKADKVIVSLHNTWVSLLRGFKNFFKASKASGNGLPVKSYFVL